MSHISICVCTYRRQELLRRLLESLRELKTGGLFTYSIVVVDNDAAESAREVAAAFGQSSGVPVTYCVERRQSIALARNKAVENATGEYLVFIDDDEFPIHEWLYILYTVCNDRKVDGVLGPVLPHYDVEPPKWVRAGRFHDRETYPTGLVIDWRKGRTGNTFLRRRIFEGLEQPFDPVFRTGEDQEFFHRMICRGFMFIWCNEAVAYEVVPPIRWDRRFMIRRSLLRGAMEPSTPDFGAREVFKSLVAIPLYSVALPFSALAGQHKMMDLLVRLFFHVGKLMAFAGLNPVREAYVTE